MRRGSRASLRNCLPFRAIVGMRPSVLRGADERHAHRLGIVSAGFQEVAMPKLEHKQAPHRAGVSTAAAGVLFNHAAHGGRAEIAALGCARLHENFEEIILESLPHPVIQRKSEALLLPVNDFGWNSK